MSGEDHDRTRNEDGTAGKDGGRIGRRRLLSGLAAVALVPATEAKAAGSATDALEETFLALVEGAKPWEVSKAAEEAYKAALKKDFDEHFEHYWQKEGEKVKRMAKHSGSFAALIGQGNATNPNDPPGKLTAREVLLGSAIVKESKGCPPANRGRWCQNAKFGTRTQALAALLKKA
jgi:hypothetical protein